MIYRNSHKFAREEKLSPLDCYSSRLFIQYSTRCSHATNNTHIIHASCRFFIYDTDTFTRKYFKEILNITQTDAIDVFEKKPVSPVTVSRLCVNWLGNVRS
jgi:hypothetical protein